MNKVVGKITRKIFESDNNYMVLLLKIKETDLDIDINKTITITGYFYDLETDLDYIFYGNMKKHNKYGVQFQVDSYQKIIPVDKNSIVTFFTSDLFKGIGEGKALKIYEELGDNAIKIIKENPDSLLNVKSLTEKNRNTIINKLKELDSSSDIIISLNEIGFNIKDATYIYKKYKEKTIEIVNNNIYDLCFDLEKISFNMVDKIAKKNNIELDDERRVSAGILYSLDILSFEKGDTYSSYDEIYSMLKIVINYQIEYSLFDNILENLINNFKVFKLDDENYQLDKYYNAEKTIVKRLTYLNNKEDLIYKANYLEKKINDFEKKYHITYDEKQRMAIINAFLKNVLIITGGPGTGKTTILKAIVNLYKDKIGEEDIVLLAPTGRASKRIMESTNFKASTIHRFLKWNKDTNRFQVNEYNKSDVKFVIIDESSMLDTLILESLLNGLKYDTRIIFIGDVNQLPSVGAGEVLKNLIESDIFPVIKLDILYRQKDDSNIISLAYDILNMEINYKIFNKKDDLMFYKSSSEDLKNHLKTIVKDYKNVNYHDFQIMAPIYKTINGIDNLNILMQSIFNPKSNSKSEIVIHDIVFREGDKVLQLLNMPDDNIYNGDIGIIVEIDNIKKEIIIDYDSNYVTFNSSNFNSFTLGYVISIHKSQGSEFNTVLIPILKEYGRMLYQKLIYTGVTRSKKKLILIGENNALDYAVSNDKNDFRKTNLKEKILKRYE